MRTGIRLQSLIVLSLTCALTTSASPSETDNLTKQVANKPATSLQAPGKKNIKSVTKVSPWALSVLERECPNLVQPYELSSNAEIVATFAGASLKSKAKHAAGNFLDRVASATKSKSKDKAKEDLDSVRSDVRYSLNQLNWLPMSLESRYGERQHQSTVGVLARDSTLGKKYYSIADQLFEKIIGGLSEEHAYKFQLFILKNDERNAIARPGGYLYIDQGLLGKPENLRKAYFAIAHEMSHVLRRHETKTLQSLIIDSFRTEADLKEALKNTETQPDKLLDRIDFSKNLYARHRVDQELQADSCAARLLARTLTSQDELMHVLNAFINELPPMVDPVPGLEDSRLLATVTSPIDSHPNSTERTQNLRSIYADILKNKSD